MSRIKRRVGGLVHKCFLQYAVRDVKVGLAYVNEQVVVTAAKRLSALVDPNGLHILAERGWQSTDYLGVLVCLVQCNIGPAKLRIHLNLSNQTVIEASVEQVGVYCDPTVDASVEHHSRTLSGKRQVLERGGI